MTVKENILWNNVLKYMKNKMTLITIPTGYVQAWAVWDYQEYLKNPNIEPIEINQSVKFLHKKYGMLNNPKYLIGVVYVEESKLKKED